MAASKKRKTQETTISNNKQALRAAEDARIVAAWLTSSLNSNTTSSKQAHLSPSEQLLHHNKASKITTNDTDNTKANNVANQEDNDENNETFSADESGEAGLSFISHPTANQGQGNGLLNRQNLSANDRLRVQLLGSKNASKNSQQRHKLPVQGAHLGSVASKPMPSRQMISKGKGNGDDDDDEAEGRTKVAAVRGKKSSDGVSDLRASDVSRVDKSKKRPASYLDELLEKRKKKK